MGGLFIARRPEARFWLSPPPHPGYTCPMWYYEQNGNRIGPVDEATMRGLIANRTISIDTLVWTNGMANWTPLQQTQLAAGLPVPPPIAGTARLALPAVPSHHPDAKDRVAYVLLAVFLGHRHPQFLRGLQYTVACIQLLVAILTCGIGWFFDVDLGIIEACTVTQDANGVRFK
jgi:hypothetical protein